MGIVNHANLSQADFIILKNCLMQMPRNFQSQLDKTTQSLIHNIIHSPIGGNDILITRGVHFAQFDPYGSFHFNIQIRNRGYYEAQEYHVYVSPQFEMFPDQGILVNVDNSVTLGYPGYWTYILYNIT